MSEYHKINGLYKRWRKDSHTPDMLPEGTQYNDFKIGEFALPEFEYLFNNQWVWSEKLDGTNIRIYLNTIGGNFNYSIKGRTDAANIPKQLAKWIDDWFHANYGNIANTFPDTELVLYGEGVGAKIQNGGLFGEQHFKLFDILIGQFYLEKPAVADIASKLNLDTPTTWIGNIQEAIDKVKTLPKSTFGDFTIEGYVGQPLVRLNNAKGERIVTKIKVRDFVRGRQ
jgi:hypothetical protein